MIDLYAGLSEDYLQNINATLSTGDYAGGTADNAAVTGTIAAPGAGKAILLKGLSFSYDADSPPAKVLTVSEGANNIVDIAVTAGGAGFLPVGVVATANTALAYSLPASGTDGVFGRLKIYYAIVDVIA